MSRTPNTVAPAALGVYRSVRIGEIEDHGSRIEAYLGSGSDRKYLGCFPTRFEARLAIERAAAEAPNGAPPS